MASRSIRCLVRRHAWREQRTEDGQVYLQCRRCGLDETGEILPSGENQALSGLMGFSAHG